MLIYEDIEASIDLFMTRQKQYENEKKKLSELCFGKKEVKSASFDLAGTKGTQSFISLEDYLLRIKKIDENVLKCKEMLNMLKAQKSEIEHKLEKLRGKKHEVFYKYRVKNLKFEKIAEDMNLSERQVRRIYQDARKQ